MFISCHFQILLAISEIQLTLHKVHTVYTVKSAVSLKWQVLFENDIKITTIFTIIFSSKMLSDSALHHWNILFYRWPEFTVGDILWYVLKL